MALFFLTVFAMLGAGCGHITAPLYHYDSNGKRVMYKRLPLRNEVDRFTRLDNVPYLPGESLNPATVSSEQREVLKRFGQPDHIRKPFKSTRKEMVGEWTYLRSNYLVQWIDGRMAYEGPVTDLERTLMDFGYPKAAFVTLDEMGIERQTWIYDDPIKASRLVFSFSNGKLVGREGGR